MDARVAVDLQLPPLATSAGEARRILRDALSGAESDDSVDAAQVALSEIVTNALVHAGTPMHLRVLLGRRHVRVELRDDSPHLPHRRDYSSVAATGRGLHMVGEMVDRWGAYPDGTGKVVWFEIAEDRSAVAAEGEVPDTQPPGILDSVEVELLNVPLLMHAAWQEHAAALLRELMLLRLDEDLSALERHAAASDALSVLFEQIPQPDLGQDPEAIMAGATEPGVSVSRLLLRVPSGSLEHFELLEEMLEDAVDLADLGELLSPPSQPEIRVMRRWLCEEVRAQGGAPARRRHGLAWLSPTDARPPTIPAELDWDTELVDRSSRALVAADDANRIVAISSPALAALGYVARDEVVGQRLISIIPLRYHQAHIAGFTLHLVNGRSPLLGNPVTVPVALADGSEREMRLQVDGTQLPSGRRVFIAELFV